MHKVKCRIFYNIKLLENINSHTNSLIPFLNKTKNFWSGKTKNGYNFFVKIFNFSFYFSHLPKYQLTRSKSCVSSIIEMKFYLVYIYIQESLSLLLNIIILVSYSCFCVILPKSIQRIDKSDLIFYWKRNLFMF